MQSLLVILTVLPVLLGFAFEAFLQLLLKLLTSLIEFGLLLLAQVMNLNPCAAAWEWRLDGEDRKSTDCKHWPTRSSCGLAINVNCRTTSGGE